MMLDAGPGTIIALIAETLQSGGGGVRRTEGCNEAWRALIQKYGIDFHIGDTVNGFGRKWALAGVRVAQGSRSAKWLSLPNRTAITRCAIERIT